MYRVGRKGLLLQTSSFIPQPLGATAHVDPTGPHGVILREVKGLDSPLLPTAIACFQRLFPEYVRYSEYVRACAIGRAPMHPARLDHVWLAEKDGEAIGLYVFCYVHTRGFGFGAFLGVDEGYRHLGLGRWFMMLAHDQYRIDAALFGKPLPYGYLGEIDIPELADDETERHAREGRINFLVRACRGVILDVHYMEPTMIGGVHYVQPTEYADVEPVPMYLIFFPSQPGVMPPPKAVRDMVEGLYLDYYRVGAESPLYLGAMQSLDRAEAE